jgi:hypothetical protein
MKWIRIWFILTLGGLSIPDASGQSPRTQSGFQTTVAPGQLAFLASLGG